jgi:hypothetical protein
LPANDSKFIGLANVCSRVQRDLTPIKTGFDLTLVRRYSHLVT